MFDTQTAKSAMEAKIAALMAKTREAGATEAEAASAIAKAHELMERYQIDEYMIAGRINSGANLRIKRAECTQKKTDCIGGSIAVVLAQYLGVKGWVSGEEIHVGGDAYKSLCAFGNSSLMKFAFEQAGRMDAAQKRSFSCGFARRVESRLMDLKLQQATAARATPEIAEAGQALVLVKTNLVAAEMQRLGIFLRAKRATKVLRDGFFAAGAMAGDRAHLGGNRQIAAH